MKATRYVTIRPVWIQLHVERRTLLSRAKGGSS